MVWKLVLAITLIAVVVEGGTSRRWPCKKAKAKLHKCRQNGYVIGECSVPEGVGEMSEKKKTRCQRMERKYGDKCDDYECVTIDSG